MIQTLHHQYPYEEHSLAACSPMELIRQAELCLRDDPELAHNLLQKAEKLAATERDPVAQFLIVLFEAQLSHLAGDTSNCELLLGSCLRQLQSLATEKRLEYGLQLLKSIETTSHFHFSFAVLRMLEPIAMEAGDWEARARLYLFRIRALMESDDPAGARVTSLEALRRLPRCYLSQRLDMASALALTETYLKRPEHVLPVIRWMLRLVRRVGAKQCSGSLLSNLSGYYANLGDYATALELIHLALPRLRSSATPNALRAGLHNLAVLHIRLGEPLLADEVFDEAIGLAIEHQLYEAVRQSTRLRARSAYENGDFSSACKWIRLCREYQDREIRREQASLSRFMQARHQSRLEELVTDQRPQELSLYMTRRRLNNCEKDLRFVLCRLEALRIKHGCCPACGSPKTRDDVIQPSLRRVRI